jgi:hypothetical protein
MSRTWRNLQGRCLAALKRPKTFNEIKQLHGLQQDYSELEWDHPTLESPLSKANRTFGRHIPTAWDDEVISGYREGKYQKYY